MMTDHLFPRHVKANETIHLFATRLLENSQINVLIKNCNKPRIRCLSGYVIVLTRHPCQLGMLLRSSADNDYDQGGIKRSRSLRRSPFAKQHKVIASGRNKDLGAPVLVWAE